jgi:beta-1,4-mannosyltransferase
MSARGGARNQVLKGELAAVVVLGELARSPRMLNHARELAANGFDVVLIGYRGREFEKPEVPAGVRVLGLDGGRSAPGGASALRFVLGAGFRMSRLGVALFRVLLREKPRTILVQNPPSFPTLTAVVLAAKCIGARVTVDWHNYGFSLLGLRLGAAHWLVRLIRRYEFRAGRRAASHLCVSRAMRDDLLRNAGIQAEVLYDRPLFNMHAERSPAFAAVCPAGWTADEDMELLLDALELVPQQTMTVYVTGEGVKRKKLQPRLLALRRKGILCDTGFLPEAEYWKLIRRADLGLSMHRSSSGLDLAMKVVDLFSAGVPVCALDYGGSIGEQIEDGATGFLFRTAQELAALLTRLASDRSALEAMRGGIRERWPASWAPEWKHVALPVLAGAS